MRKAIILEPILGKNSSELCLKTSYRKLKSTTVIWPRKISVAHMVLNYSMKNDAIFLMLQVDLFTEFQAVVEMVLNVEICGDFLAADTLGKV